MPRIKLTPTLEIQTFPRIPASYRSGKAEPDALRRYGLPERPNEAALAGLWDDLLKERPEIIQPSFHVVEGAAAVPLLPQEDSLLAGAFVDAPEDDWFTWITATWTVPSLHFPDNYDEAHEDDYNLEAWIALHKDSPASLWCGYIGNVRWEQDGPVVTYTPMWQWAQEPKVAIEDFPLTAGDTITCLICMDIETGRARIYYSNRTSGMALSFMVRGRDHTIGTRAGWYVKPSIVTSSGPVLARFAALYFDGCYAGTEDHAVLAPTTPVYLTDLQTDKPIVVASLLTERVCRVGYVKSTSP